MAHLKTLWILFGLFLQNQLLTADKTDNSGDTLKEVKTDTSDESVQFTNEGLESQQPDVPINDMEIEKRGIGKWKNIMWSQTQGKRNIGRWKNRNWRDMQSYGLQGRSGRASYSHYLSKRFSGDSDNDKMSENTFKDIPEYGILNGDFILPDSYGLDDLYGDESEDEQDYNVDKRHRSRWNLIHRKLSQLNAKKRADAPDDVKRMASRWRIIQNKLNQLHSSNSKRFAGRWKNQNWLLEQANKQ